MLTPNKVKKFSSQIESKGYAEAIKDTYGYEPKRFYNEKEQKFEVVVPKKWRIL